MRQVLFWLPLHSLANFLPDIPIYGYGTMLFLAFVLCTWLACKLAEREGYPRTPIQDMAIWMFIAGILGARITFMIQYRNRFRNLWQFFAIWDGGLVFYGSFIGGIIGFFLAYYVFLRKYHVSRWKMVDILAPYLALGLCLGRIGCLLNGCCYGNVACPDCLAVHFPLSSPPKETFIDRGLQTVAGFTLAGSGKLTVGRVEPDSPAARAGLRDGDRLLKINGKEVDIYQDLVQYLFGEWERGKNDLLVSVRHADGQEEDLPAFGPLTLGLHPTQIYESISMALLFFVLLTYYPLKKKDGSVFVLFLVAYGVHRFLNEMLRTDTEKVAFDMTLSQNISIMVLASAIVLGLLIWRRPAQPTLNSPLPTGSG